MITSQLDLKKDSLRHEESLPKMVPKLLNDDQEDCCMEMCQDVLNHLQNEPDLLGRVITDDETYIFEYDPENHVPELSEVESPRPKKARQSNPKVKVMLIAFLNVKGIINCEFLPQDQTINQQVYREMMWRLLCLVNRKRQELWQGKLWLLHHNNAPFTMLAPTVLSREEYRCAGTTSLLN